MRAARLCLLAAALGGCGARDVRGQGRWAEPTSARLTTDAGSTPHHVSAVPAIAGARPQTLARTNSRAIAVDAAHVYFGSDSDDALFVIDKLVRENAEPKRLARHAPIHGALSYDAHDTTLAWIGSPGDAVFRVSAAGGAPSTVRDRGIFTDVVSSGGDVFITEAQGSGGVLTRVTGPTAARLASIEGTPHGIVVDGDQVFVATSSRLAATSRTRGSVKEIARGAGFESPQFDDGWVFATMVDPKQSRTRTLVRVAKTGGPLETLATGVRDAPIAVSQGVVYWFDAESGKLLAADARGTTPATARLVSLDPVFEHVRALAVDDDGAFIAAGTGEDARIVVVSFR